jgi:DNA-binding LytR/AlgR family response regulator
MTRVTALIADDEAPLRGLLRDRLARGWPELEIVAEAPDGIEALRLLAAHHPEVAFLDIQMPGLSGLEVAARATDPCQWVFVTAYDQYAVPAFENAAVDYLLKPVSADRLAKTVARLRARLGRAPPDFAPLLAQISQAIASPKRYLQWLNVAARDEIHLLPVAEVDYFQADDKYTTVVTREREWIIRTPLKELEASLDPDGFWRIHRNTIVRIAAVTRVTRDFQGRCLLELAGRSEPVTVSRRYAYRFKQM